MVALFRNMTALTLAVSATAVQGEGPLPPVVIERSATDIVVEADGSSRSVVEIVLRATSPAGAQAASAFPVPVSAALQRFELIEAWTETADGKRIDVKPEQVMTQSPPFNAAAQTLSDLQLKIVPFPQVAAGAALHVKFAVTQTKPYLSGAFWHQQLVPTSAVSLDGRGSISVPAGMKLAVDASQATVEPARVVGGRTVTSWTIRNPVMIPPERGAVSPFDYAPHVYATNLAGWTDLAKAYRAGAGSAETPTPEIRALAAELTKSATTPRDKARVLSEFVRDKVNYVNIVLGTGGFVPKPAGEVLEKRFGDCKGKSTLLVALLAAAGIDSTPALVMSQPAYREPTVALPLFDHLIVYIPLLDQFVDATAPYVPFGDLPDALDAKFVVLTHSGATRRIPLDNGPPDRSIATTRLTIAADGSIEGATDTVLTGGDAIGARGWSVAARLRNPAQVARDLMSDAALAGTGKVVLPDPDAPGADTRIAASYRLDPGDLPDAVKIPSPLTMRSLREVANGVNREAVIHPFNCGSAELIERSELTPPPGRVFGALPKDVAVDTRFIRYRATYRAEGATLKVERVYNSRYPAQPCEAAWLPSIRDAKLAMLRDLNATVTLVNK